MNNNVKTVILPPESFIDENLTITGNTRKSSSRSRKKQTATIGDVDYSTLTRSRKSSSS
jgi:hypothetical protein